MVGLLLGENGSKFLVVHTPAFKPGHPWGSLGVRSRSAGIEEGRASKVPKLPEPDDSLLEG